MPRYYFHTMTSSATILDTEGTDLATPQEALEEAVKDARTLMAAAILLGRDISSRRMVVQDENGLVLIVPFSDTIRPCP